MRKYLASMPSPRRGAAIGTTPSELGIMKGAGLALRSSGLGFAIVCRVRLRDPGISNTHQVCSYGAMRAPPARV